jgi:radical SAM protein with 4Fe4S-binding SPASM domain
MDTIVLNPKGIINPVYHFYSNQYNTFHKLYNIKEYYNSKYFEKIEKKEWLLDKCKSCNYLEECN